MAPLWGTDPSILLKVYRQHLASRVANPAEEGEVEEEVEEAVGDAGPFSLRWPP